MNDDLLRAALLDHFHRPRNRRPLPDATASGSGSNPQCGDRVDVSVTVGANEVHDVAFQGQGCSVCIASASLMTEATCNHPLGDVKALCGRIRNWLETDGDPWQPPVALRHLALFRGRPARRRCALLAWEALDAALENLEST